jgi:hypothetical protein
MTELTLFMRHHIASSGVVIGVMNIIAKAAKVDQVDAEQHKPLFHALMIIGAWSALEAYVGDFCKAVMREQPELLDSDEIQSIKVPLAELLADNDDKVEQVYLALDKNFGRGTGVYRFESVLKHLGLSEPVPGDIRKALLQAQKIRNVWAHNAGRADSQFLKNATVPGFELGDKVAISGDDVKLYAAVLLMYGHIITSRWRVKNGLDAFAAPEDTPLRESYESIYPPKPPE